MYRALLGARPGERRGAYNLGLALKQQDDFAGAEVELRKAARARSRRCRRRRSRSASCSGRPAGPTRRCSSSATPIARKPDYADAHYMLGTVLKQQGAIDDAIAAVPGGHPVPAALRRSTPEPRPGAEPAGRHGRRRGGARRSGAAEPENGRRAGLDVRGQRRRAEGEGRRRPRRHRAVSARPSASRPTTRRRTISSRSRCGAPARGPRPTRTSPTAHRLAPYLTPPATTSHDVHARIGAGRRVLAVADAVSCSRSASAASASSRPPAARRCAARLLVHEHGTRRPASTRDHRLRRQGDQQVPARDDRLRRRRPRLRRRRLARHLRRQRPDARGLPGRRRRRPATSIATGATARSRT